MTDFVQHKIHHYLGVVAGKTWIQSLFENQSDSEEYRVKLPTGKIRIASGVNLRAIDKLEYEQPCAELPLETLAGGRPKRIGAYWDRIKFRITQFWQPGQQITVTRIFTRENSVCELCEKAPIKWNHVLENQTTKTVLTVGSECVRNYHQLTDVPVLFEHRLARAAHYFNDRDPGCAKIKPNMEHTLDGDLTNDLEDLPGEADMDAYILALHHHELGLDPNEPHYGDLAAEGLDPDEIDWESGGLEPN